MKAELDARVSELENGSSSHSEQVLELQRIAELRVTAEILRHAQIGKRIRAFGKSAEAEVAAAAQNVISQWKEQLLSQA